jgi:hypothetical protein
MYHSSTENQVFNINKSFLTKGFSSKDLQTYIAELTPSQREIAHYFLKFRNACETKFINSTIAKKIGCNVRTVIRATNKFNEDGFIIKHQPEPYDINRYTFNEKLRRGSDAFMYWLNDLPTKSQDTYISHGIFIDHKNKRVVTQRNVTPYLSSSILDNLFKKSSLRLTCARERGQGFSKKIKGKMMKPYGNPKKILKSPEPLLTYEQQREELIKKIDACRRKLADPHKYVSFSVEASIVYFEKELQQHLKDLEQIGSSNEKQSISYQYQSDTMATYSS